MSDLRGDVRAGGQSVVACGTNGVEAARMLYVELLDHKDEIGQAFLNGYRRCLMVFDPDFLPGVSADAVSSDDGE